MSSPTVTAERLKIALKSLDADSWAKQRGKLPNADLVEMLLCDMQRAREILEGKTYFDYDSQKWVEGSTS